MATGPILKLLFIDSKVGLTNGRLGCVVENEHDYSWSVQIDGLEIDAGREDNLDVARAKVLAVFEREVKEREQQPTRTVNGRPMFWHGHRVERMGEPGAFSYRTICGIEDVPSVWLSCGDDPLDCMDCALALDAEKIP